MKKYVILLLLVSMSAYSGHDNGHGGDGRAASFVSMAYDVLNDLYQNPIKEIDTEKLRSVISNTKVTSSTNTLYNLDGKKVDAINHPK